MTLSSSHAAFHKGVPCETRRQEAPCCYGVPTNPGSQEFANHRLADLAGESLLKFRHIGNHAFCC
jgi:hypothetical protein